jgi:hypothetical protein
MLSFIFAFACTMGKESAADSETGTTEDSDSPVTIDCATVAFTATGSQGTCDGNGVCTWSVDMTNTSGTVTLYLIETGDPGFDASTCGAGKGGVNCGVWSEVHDAFAVSGASGDCGEVKSIGLQAVGSFQDQVDNTSTLFDTEIGSTVSWFYVAEGTDGTTSCSSGGHNPGALDMTAMGC